MRVALFLAIPLLVFVASLVALRVERYREEARIRRWFERSAKRSDADAERRP